ncbi:ABC transporter substrate-binding protein [Oceanobacillus sp. CFH 90083]|uniref:ABC transporter substrate-binding protein n=1 Tax=Oceanobacillus sp. CFH 90083 TaxID=2592336 RepID=UPI00128B9D78|nr:extracellular solute-binding protein [Oceanobacillus sp. CFH 90083]
MKSFRWVVVGLLTVLVLSACGGDNNSDGDTKEIEFWHMLDNDAKEWVERKATEFEEENPGVKINTVANTGDAFKQKMTVAMNGGNPPDVFLNYGGGWLGQFVEQGNVLEITDSIDKDIYVESALSAVTYNDGQVYGVPLSLTMDVIWYNKEIFADLGLEEPETYEEFQEIITVLKENDIYPIALANKSKWPGSYMFMNMVSKLGGHELFDDALNRNGKGFDDAIFVEAGENIKELVEMDAYNPGFNGLPYNEGGSRQLFYSGEAAMFNMHNAVLNDFRIEAPDFVDKVGFFMFPDMEGGVNNPGEIGGAISPAWSVSSKAEHPEIATEFVKFLTTPEAAQEYADETGSVTALKGISPEGELEEQFAEVILNSTSIQSPYDQALPPELAELHKDTLQSIYGLSMTPEEAAKQMEEKAKEILGE